MTSTDPSQKCGTIALVGSPNAGKSTLINSLVGQKIVGVSAKPQTTRNRVLGIVTEHNTQFLFVDTPGIHKAPKATSLNNFMNREAWEGVREADVVCLLLPVHKSPTKKDLETYRQIKESHGEKMVLLFTQCDRIKKAEWKQKRAPEFARLLQSVAPGDMPPAFVISAKQKETLQGFLHSMAERMPLGPFLYDPEQLTNRPTRFVIQELIRESLFRNLGKEVPYQCAVRIENIDMTVSPVLVQAAILVTRTTLKSLILGKNGAKIKEIGTLARASIESMLDAPAFLELFVRVEANWDQDLNLIGEVLDEGVLS